MSLVDASRLGFFRPGILEDIFLRGVPENGIVDAAHGKILRNTFDPSRKTIKYLTSRNFQGNLMDVKKKILKMIQGYKKKAKITDLYFRIVRDSRAFIDSRNKDFPNTKGILYHAVGISIPLVYLRKQLPIKEAFIRRN